MKNVIIWNAPSLEDRAMFEKHFEPLSDCLLLPESTSLEELMVLAEVFKSKGEARKNGFSGSIPDGCGVLGTKKNKFWCWKRPA